MRHLEPRTATENKERKFNNCGDPAAKPGADWRVQCLSGRESLLRMISAALALVTISHPGFSQTPFMFNPGHAFDNPIHSLNVEETAPAGVNPSANSSSDDPDRTQPDSAGRAHRGAARLWRDQKELYSAPFQRPNFKWDAIVLAGTGALLSTDRRIERHLPGGNVDIYGNISNVALGGTAAALALSWSYGIKTHNEHLKETGSLEVEALVNTFLIYTPMQFAAGRQRPGEGNGYGDFGRHHNIDTSFPAGHPMFTIAMASVVAHEYPKPWVEVLAYGAAAAVMGGRLLGRDHWSSDVFVGSALGYFIGSHIFHSRCNSALSPACHPR
jgi:PAP2 superfamily